MAINFLNTVAVDENVLFVDTVNDQVGIGTVSPSAKLEVVSSSQTLSTAKFDSIELQTYTVNNSWVGENLYYDGSFKYRADGYATALYFAADGFDIRTAPSGTAGTVATLTTAFTLLESSGNVGIGTDSPSQKLHVDGNARVTGAYYDSGNTPGTANQLLASTATGTAWIDPSTIVAEAATLVVIACKNTSGATIAQGTPVYQTGTVGATATIEIAPADALISANKLPAIGLLQTDLNNNGFGNVVITGELTNFTTDPIDGLTPTVGDKIFVKSGGGLTLTKPTGEGNGIQNMGLVGKVSSGNSGSITVSSIMRTNDVPNLPEGRIWVGDGNTTVSDTVYVDETNNRVGIGTDSPDYKLDVEGSANNADIGIRINNSFDDNLATSNPNAVLFLNAASNNGYLRVHGAPANTAAKHQIDLGSSASSSFLTFSPSGEKMRITNAGGISFGSTGTAYGTSGQVLTSAGDASPTWTTPTTGTVTGTGSVNQVAFWTDTDSLSGTDKLYWDSTNDHLGIGDGTPGSRLKVASGTSETSIYTVDINHVRNDANVATHAMRLNVDLSGADTTTADRTSSGLFIDLDSSANGDASNEHRIRGVNSDVRFTGFSDSVQSGYFLAESNNTTEKTALLMGLQAQASHDSSSTSGGVSNMYGVYGLSSIQDLGDVDNAFGGLFITSIPSSRGAANVGITKGVEGRVSIDKPDTITYGAMTAVSGIIDNNETTFPTFGNQYLFKGDYQGTKGGSAYGIYTEGDKHYFDGNIGIGATNPASRLTVQENGITTKIATVTIGDTTAGASLTLRGGSPTIYFDRTGADPENKILMDSAGLEFKTGTLDAEGDVDFKINPDGSLQLAKGAKISNQENTDIDSAAAEVVAQVAISYTAAFFDFVVKKGTNVRSGTVYACHDGTNVEFTETSTNDLGDTSDVTLSVDKTSTNLRLIATVTSDDWSVKSLIRAI